jgi:hypothetical protein
MSEKMIDHIVDEHNIDLDSQLLKKVKVRLKWSIEYSIFLCFVSLAATFISDPYPHPIPKYFNFFISQ